MLQNKKLQRLQQLYKVCVELETGEFILIKNGTYYGSFTSINKAHKQVFGY